MYDGASAIERGRARGRSLSLARLLGKGKAGLATAEEASVPPPASTVRHRLDWADGAVLWTIDESGAGGDGFMPVALKAGRSLVFAVTPPAEALASLAVRVGTYQRTNSGTLRCSLRRPWNVVLASGAVDLSTLNDNDFAPLLDLDGVAFEPGQACLVELSLDAEPGNEIALYIADADERRPPARRHLRGFVPGTAIGTGEAVGGLLPNFRLDWAERDAFWATWPSGFDEAARALSLALGSPFEFDVVAPARRLDTVSVQFGTYARRARSHLAFELVDPVGDVLHREAVDLAGVADNGFGVVGHLGGLDLEPGRKYRARLHWLGPEGEGVAVYAAPVRVGRYELRRHLERLVPDRVFTARSWAKAEREAERAFLILDPVAADRPAPLGSLPSGSVTVPPGCRTPYAPAFRWHCELYVTLADTARGSIWLTGLACI